MTMLGSSSGVGPPTEEVQVHSLPEPPPDGGEFSANGAVADGPTPVPNRLQRLAQVVDRSRRGRSDRDIRKIMHMVGMAVLSFGFVAIFAGWYGASHEPHMFEWIPYLISGGLGGLAMVMAGGVLVRCAWSLRQIEEMRRNAGAIVRSVERLESVLLATLADPHHDDQLQEQN
jgi:hypothetical protein